MSIKLLAIYFVVGGAVIAAVSYFGSHGKGMVAAFIANMPLMTLITLCTVYFSGGQATAISYVKGILLLLPAWLLYAFAVLFLLPRLGIVPAVMIGVSLYVGSAVATMKIVH